MNTFEEWWEKFGHGAPHFYGSVTKRVAKTARNESAQQHTFPYYALALLDILGLEAVFDESTPEKILKEVERIKTMNPSKTKVYRIVYRGEDPLDIDRPHPTRDIHVAADSLHEAIDKAMALLGVDMTQEPEILSCDWVLSNLYCVITEDPPE